MMVLAHVLAVWAAAGLLTGLVLARIGYNLKRHHRSNR